MTRGRVCTCSALATRAYQLRSSGSKMSRRKIFTDCTTGDGVDGAADPESGAVWAASSG